MSEKKSTFSVTCSLLSRFLREKRSFGELVVLDGESKPQEQAKGLFRPATTMSFLRGAEVSAENQTETDQNATKSVGLFPQQTGFGCAEKKTVAKEPQLTIFYDGKVLVFDNFAPEKANELMQLAASGSVEADRPPPRGRLSTPTAVQPSPSELPMPMAKRASLHRFFEKRKDRISSYSPYQVNRNSSPIAGSGKPEQTRSWLGLGQDISNSSSSS